MSSKADKSIKTSDKTETTISSVDTEGQKQEWKDYVPLVLELSKTEEKMFGHNEDPKFSINIDYPRFSLGFQHYIHANKNKMVILSQFENKKKVYRVMNQFESDIDNYDDSISNATKKYFNLTGDTPTILSRGFYKLWELLNMFDIIDVNQDNFVSAHLAEGPGSFVQATMFYRDKYSKKSKNDKYYAITLHPEDTDGYVPDLEQNFVDYYAKEKPQRFILHKTYTKKQSGGSKRKDNGDLTDPKTVKLFGGEMKERAHLVTADGGFNWENENTQEQEAFRLIFGQIYTGLKIQQKGGTFICKFFETYTMTSIKFISILTHFYEKIYLVKPLMSRPSNSEKYVVCVNFKFNENDGEYKKMINKLENIHAEAHKNLKLHLVDIFPEYEPSQELIDRIIYINLEIANTQFRSLNEIVEFINSQNYYGDTYQMRRDMQIYANKYWISRFYPLPNNHTKTHSDIIRETSEVIKNTNSKIKKY